MLWHDGRLIEGDVAPFDLRDRGLLIGDGVFDTALALNGRIVFEAEHVARLEAALATLGIPIESARILEAMRAVAAAGATSVVRTTATRGPGPRGLRPPDDPLPTLFATGAPARAGLAFAPLRLATTSIRRNDTSPAASLKVLGYLDAVLAAERAGQDGFDDALFLNTRGRIACAGTANVFVWRDGVLATPPVSEGVLPGVTRAALIAAAGRLGITAVEQPLDPSVLDGAEAVFVTNSLRLIAPVTAIDAWTFDSQGHPAFPLLRDALRQAACASCGAPPDALR